LNGSFTSFLFDDEHEGNPPAAAAAEPRSIATPDGAGSTEPVAPADSPAPAPAPAPVPLASPPAATPSSKLQRRFSMSSPLDMFSSFIETKASPAAHSHSKQESSGGGAGAVVPHAYREVTEEGVPIHNPRNLRMQATLKTFSTSGINNLVVFEKEQIENRMRRCLELAATAVNNKFVPQGKRNKYLVLKSFFLNR
jgi:hypothetical protein